MKENWLFNLFRPKKKLINKVDTHPLDNAKFARYIRTLMSKRKLTYNKLNSEFVTKHKIPELKWSLTDSLESLDTPEIRAYCQSFIKFNCKCRSEEFIKFISSRI